MNELIPRIGVGVFVFKNGKFLMGKRVGAHGEGSWSVPGGHLEFGESIEGAAMREVMEETGLSIAGVRVGAVTNDIFKDENKHYVTVWVTSKWANGKERKVEPDKFVELGWYDFANLPRPLFLPWKQLLKSDFMPTLEHRLQVQ